jgi:hypothetical protein
LDSPTVFSPSSLTTGEAFPLSAVANANSSFSSGQSVVRYIRGYGYHHIPILIHTTRVDYTRYVENYSLCGSSYSANIVKRYIKALKDGVVTDTEWIGFDPSTLLYDFS